MPIFLGSPTKCVMTWIDAHTLKDPPLEANLGFTAVQDSTVRLDKVGSSVITGFNGLEYRKTTATDMSDWTSYVIGVDIPLAIGDKLYFRSVAQGNETISLNFTVYHTFVMTGEIQASGNIMSLLDRYLKKTTITHQNAFFKLFDNCDALITVPELPAKMVAAAGYFNLFSGCTRLTEMPALLANTLGDSAYAYMFKGCTALTSVHQLSVDNVASNAYYCMFEESGIEETPELFAVTADKQGFRNMFKNCKSLKTVTNFPQIDILVENCCREMFNGCSMLSSIPVEFPATTFGVGSCYDMFNGCSSLVNPTQFKENSTIGFDAWQCVYQGCQSLSAVPKIYGTIPTFLGELSVNSMGTLSHVRANMIALSTDVIPQIEFPNVMPADLQTVYPTSHLIGQDLPGSAIIMIMVGILCDDMVSPSKITTTLKLGDGTTIPYSQVPLS